MRTSFTLILLVVCFITRKVFCFVHSSKLLLTSNSDSQSVWKIYQQLFIAPTHITWDDGIDNENRKGISKNVESKMINVLLRNGEYSSSDYLSKYRLQEIEFACRNIKDGLSGLNIIIV